MNYKVILNFTLLIIIFAIAAVFLSKDKPTAALTAFSVLLAAFSIMISVDSAKKSNEHTEKTLKLTEKSNEYTEKTLKLTETEQQIRDIEKRLELFYYPVLNYFKIKRGEGSKSGLTIDDNRARIHAESFRYLADENTRKTFETWLKAITDTKETHKAEKEKSLTDALKADIEYYQKKLTELENNKKALLD